MLHDKKLITAGVPLKDLPPSVLPRVRAARKAVATRKLRERAGVAAPRDSQRQRVYDWERSYVFGKFEGDHETTLSEIAPVIVAAYALFGFEFDPSQQLRDGRGRKNACFDYNIAGGCIKLPRWARKKSVALHEAAHGIVWLLHAKNWRAFQGHGVEFVSVYMELLQSFTPLKGDYLLQSARESRLQLTPGTAAAAAAAASTSKKRSSLKRSSKLDKLQDQIKKIEVQIAALTAKKREIRAAVIALRKKNVGSK